MDTKELNPGDKIYCGVKDTELVSCYAEVDEYIIFEIIAKDTRGFFLYIPHYLIIKDTQQVDITLAKSYNINTKFLNCQCAYIGHGKVYKIHSISDGAICKKCCEFSRFASTNQQDGSFLCFTCRTYRNY